MSCNRFREGIGTKTSETFEITGPKIRLEWSYTPDRSMAEALIHVKIFREGVGTPVKTMEEGGTTLVCSGVLRRHFYTSTLESQRDQMYS